MDYPIFSVWIRHATWASATPFDSFEDALLSVCGKGYQHWSITRLDDNGCVELANNGTKNFGFHTLGDTHYLRETTLEYEGRL